MSVVTPRSARREGMSRSGLYRAAREGRYERVARGIYVPVDAGASDWDWVEAATRRSDATICLVSALAQHDLTDEIPAALDVAVPRGSRRPTTEAAIRWHAFDRATFDIGRDTVVVPGTDLRIGLYSAERSIVDAFRLRGDVGYELARESLTEWLRRGGKPADLIAIASEVPRAKGPLLRALEVLA